MRMDYKSQGEEKTSELIQYGLQRSSNCILVMIQTIMSAPHPLKSGKISKKRSLNTKIKLKERQCYFCKLQCFYIYLWFGNMLQTKKLNEKQWDRLVDHLHRTNKMKERWVSCESSQLSVARYILVILCSFSALMKEQNQGLALELNGLSFKPEMNATSLQLASTMKSLEHRLPGMISKREAALERRRAEQKEVYFVIFIY